MVMGAVVAHNNAEEERNGRPRQGRSVEEFDVVAREKVPLSGDANAELQVTQVLVEQLQRRAPSPQPVGRTRIIEQIR